jgi:hypothetical protein
MAHHSIAGRVARDFVEDKVSPTTWVEPRPLGLSSPPCAGGAALGGPGQFRLGDQVRTHTNKLLFVPAVYDQGIGELPAGSAERIAAARLIFSQRHGRAQARGTTQPATSRNLHGAVARRK